MDSSVKNGSESSFNPKGVYGTVELFAREKKHLYFLVIIASAVYGVMSVAPYYFIWKLAVHIAENFSSPDLDTVVRYALYIGISQIIGIGMNFASLLSSHILAFRIEKNIRKESLKHLVRLPVGFFANEDSGRLRRLIDDNASKTHSLIAHSFPDFTSSLVVPAVLIFMLFTVNIKFGIICILSVLLAFMNMRSFTSEEAKTFMGKYMTAAERLSVSGLEYIRGIPVVKVFNQTVESFQRYYRTIMEYDQDAKNFVNFCRRPMILYTVSLYLPAVVLGPVCIFLINRGGEPLELLNEYLFYVIISLLFNSVLMKVNTISESKNQFEVIMERLKEIFALEPMKVRTGCSESAVSEDSKASEEDFKDEEGIVFDNVYFSYTGDENYVLKNINLKFKKNRTYAIVGGSGSGKTTLVNLIGRFYDVSSGSIRIGGKDIREMTEDELMSQMSIVFQQSSLLQRSIRENIDMDFGASDEEIMKAVRDSNSEDIIGRMEDGLDTVIGTEGTYLSGGEKQRIALARAFLRKRDILLLDEVTAFADPENEEKIGQSIDRLKKGRTTVMIAHRLNTVRDADEIIVLSSGEVEDRGRHEELLERCRTYRELYEEFSKGIEWRAEND